MSRRKPVPRDTSVIPPTERRCLYIQARHPHRRRDDAGSAFSRSRTQAQPWASFAVL